jgi:hypothetical protein
MKIGDLIHLSGSFICDVFGQLHERFLNDDKKEPCSENGDGQRHKNEEASDQLILYKILAKIDDPASYRNMNEIQ